MSKKKKSSLANFPAKDSIINDSAEPQAELSQENIQESVTQESEQIINLKENNQKDEIQVSDEKVLKTVRIKRTIGHEQRTNRWGYIFVLPFLLAFLIFNFWPTVNTILISATDLKGLRNDYIFANAICPNCDGEKAIFDIDEATGDLIMDDFGNYAEIECNDCDENGRVLPIAYNYGRLVKDRFFWGALGNTFIIWMFNFVPQLGIALILAIWLSDTQLNLTGKGLFRAVIYMPNLLTAASVALLYRSIFGADGHVNAPANQFLRSLGIYYNNEAQGIAQDAFNFFRSVPFTRGLVAFIQWWMWYGHTLILLMAGITSIPTSLYESATVDGANSRQTAWYITLPLLRPMMLFVLVTSMIGGMQMFDIPFLLTNRFGGPDYKIRTTVLYQYNIAFMGTANRSYGAAISMGIFVVTIILALLIFFFLQDRSELKKKKGGL